MKAALRPILLLGLILAAGLAGCGYRFSGTGYSLPAGVRTLHVDLFVNRTAEPFLENLVTEQVATEFLHKGGRPLVPDPAKADAVLSGEIVAYRTTPLSYDRNDDITEYRSEMTLAAVLQDLTGGRILWKGTLSWQEDYRASSDKALQDDREAAAIRVISQRLAEELFARITENF